MAALLERSLLSVSRLSCMAQLSKALLPSTSREFIIPGVQLGLYRDNAQATE